MGMVKHFVPPAVKHVVKRVDEGWRILTGPIRLLPDFIIIGAQKCGTTSLYRYLMQHPCVVPPFRKEVHFFSIHFGRGLTWYQSHFPSFLYKAYTRQTRGRNLVIGEASPYYIFHPVAPKRISETIPQVELIAMLRNPVDRAYSHYHHEVRKGRETLPFEAAIEREAERLAGETERMIEDENYYSFNHHRYTYLSRGIYVNQLEIWLRFFSREQILILKSEDLYADSSTVLRHVLEFLNLPAWEPKEYMNYNPAGYPRMNPNTKKRLTDYFEPHNQRLYKYLGASFDW